MACKRALLRAIDKDPHIDLLTADLSAFRVTEVQTKPTTTIATGEESLLDLWHRYTRSLNLTRYTESGHYLAIYRMLERREPIGLTDPTLLNGYSRWTWHHRRSALVRALTWANKVDEAKYWASLRCPRSAKSRPNPEPLSHDEARQLMTALEDDPNKWAILFLLDTAVRIGELLAVRFEDITDDGRVTIRAAKVRRRYGSNPNKLIRTDTGKTNEPRTIPLTPKLLTYIRSLNPRSKRSAVFPISASSLRRSIHNAYLRTGIKARKLSATRHTRLSWVAKKQGLMAASKLAGHRDLSMVIRHYARETEDIEIEPTI
jgi:integrase